MTRKITDLEGRMDAALKRADKARPKRKPCAMDSQSAFPVPCTCCPVHGSDDKGRAICSCPNVPPTFNVKNRAGVQLAAVKQAHDALSEAIEDPDGGNDAEHDAAVRLLEELNAYYREVK